MNPVERDVAPEQDAIDSTADTAESAAMAVSGEAGASVDTAEVKQLPAEPGKRAQLETSLGQLLLQAGAIKSRDIKKIVARQLAERLRFGDAAIQLRLINPEDLQRALARQFSFPFMSAGDAALSRELYVAFEPLSKRTEAIRSLRTQLMLRWFKDESKALAVLEPRADSGASALAANLALSFAQLGERTLLIDANFRQPRQQALFGLGAEPLMGLSNVLAGRQNLKEVLRPIEPYSMLSLLCAGAPPPNPQELLGQVNFSYVIETAPSVFDVVLIDAPPVIDFADAQIIAARATGCLLVARRDRTRVADLQRAKVELQPTGAQLLGVVMC